MQPCKKRCPGPEGAALWIDFVFFSLSFPLPAQVGAVPPPPPAQPCCVRACVCVCNGIFFLCKFFLLIFYAPRACPASVCVCVRPCVVFVFCSYCFPSCSSSSSSSCVCVFFVSCFLTVSRGVSFGWWPRFSQDMKRCTALGVDHGRAGQGRPGSGSGSGSG